MNGPSHYCEAEKLLRAADLAQEDELARHYLASAQVHATLALSAATALTPAYGPHVAEGSAAAAWRTILSVPITRERPAP